METGRSHRRLLQDAGGLGNVSVEMEVTKSNDFGDIYQAHPPRCKGLGCEPGLLVRVI
jgi:hypothetical protein